ncbi:HAD domain-containing protein [Thiohalorhabdus methylotrophus]|uniref:HAD domain-containing protein n=1 Tax=Thiohalorhabdus methylotrophus TaxID=3242694 RepID=A0ABV4U0Q8_9GAMM
MVTANRVLFLDFDGVVNRRSTLAPGQGRFDSGTVNEGEGCTWRWVDPERCALLEDRLVGRVRDLVVEAEAQVIVSSDWRTVLELGEISDLLAAAGWPDAPLVGTTDPDLAYSFCRRFEEVADWLRRNGEPVAWVALDDQWGDRDGLGYPVVEVDPEQGLQDDDVARALAILNGQ